MKTEKQWQFALMDIEEKLLDRSTPKMERLVRSRRGKQHIQMDKSSDVVKGEIKGAGNGVQSLKDLF